MSRERYRYRFGPDVPAEEIEATLMLAIGAAESLHGETQVRLDVRYDLNIEARTCILDASTPSGRDANRLFVGFVRGQFGEGSFVVDRVGARSPQPAID